jgi:hypothetical protein
MSDRLGAMGAPPPPFHQKSATCTCGRTITFAYLDRFEDGWREGIRVGRGEAIKDHEAYHRGVEEGKKFVARQVHILVDEWDDFHD